MFAADLVGGSQGFVSVALEQEVCVLREGSEDVEEVRSGTRPECRDQLLEVAGHGEAKTTLDGRSFRCVRGLSLGWFSWSAQESDDLLDAVVHRWALGPTFL